MRVLGEHPGDRDSPGSQPPAAGAGRGLPAVYARLRLRDALPLHAGERVLLRDPGAAGLAIYGATVLDPVPPPLSRRGAATAARRELATWPAAPTAADLLRRHQLLRASQLAATGAPGLPEPVAGDWLADPAHWSRLRAELPKAVAAFSAKDPLAPGMPLDAARTALGLPSRALVVALASGNVILEAGVPGSAASGGKAPPDPPAGGLPVPPHPPGPPGTPAGCRPRRPGGPR